MPNIPPGTQVKDLSLLARMQTAWQVLTGKQPAGSPQSEVDAAQARIDSRPFGPGGPLAPYTDATSPERTQGPRQWQYPMYSNRTTTPRGEIPGLTPFAQLRSLAELYDVAALCINVRIEEIQGLKFSIVAKDKRRQKELQSWCDQAEAFWAYPDQLNDWGTWCGLLLYDLFSIDAPTLYKRPDLAGRLYGLEVIDGATIKPLIDERGRTLAYQQILYGYPMSDYKRPGADAPDETYPTYGRHELMYLPRWPRSHSPYGCSPTEKIILRVNFALRKQAYDMAYFTSGNIPDMLALVPEGLNPEQLDQFEEAFNAVLEGVDSARRKMRFMPFKADIKELKPFSYDTQIDRFMLGITCAAYGVTPQELGFVEDVNRANGEMQENLNERRGLGPLKLWLKRSIFDPITQRDLTPTDETVVYSWPGQPSRPQRSPMSLLECQWTGGNDEDTLKQAQTDQIYYTMGAISASEIRTMRYGEVLDGEAPGAPADALPVAKLAKMSDAQADAERLKKEAAARRLFEQVYASQGERIKAALGEAGITPETWQPDADWYLALWESEGGLVAAEVQEFYDSLVMAGAELGSERLPIGVDWEQMSAPAYELSNRLARAFAEEMTTSSQSAVYQMIASWTEQGGTMPQLISRIATVWTGPRPDVAAVTEVTRIYSQAQRLSWQQSGLVEQWRFRTVRDKHVCPICEPLDGQAYPISNVADLPPKHPRCRCDVAPVVKSPEELF